MWPRCPPILVMGPQPMRPNRSCVRLIEKHNGWFEIRSQEREPPNPRARSSVSARRQRRAPSSVPCLAVWPLLCSGPTCQNHTGASLWVAQGSAPFSGIRTACEPGTTACEGKKHTNLSPVTLTPSTSGTGPPVTWREPRSKGTANRTLFSTYARWPVGRYRPSRPPSTNTMRSPVVTDWTTTCPSSHDPVP